MNLGKVEIWETSLDRIVTLREGAKGVLRQCSRRVLGLKRSIGRDYNQVPISLSLIEGTCASGTIRSAPALQAHPGVSTGRLPPTHMSRMLRTWPREQAPARTRVFRLI